jgi:hypothetical protein
MRLLAIPLLLLPLLAACASTGTEASETSSRNAITAAELAGVSELMTLDAIRRLRPAWLRSRAAPTPAAFRQGGVEPALRLDGILREGLQELETLPVRDVLEITFLSATDATTLYGTGYVNGIIQVRTRSRE